MKNRKIFVILVVLYFLVILGFVYLFKNKFIFLNFNNLLKKENIFDSFVYNLKSQYYALSGDYIRSNIYLTGKDFRYYFNKANNNLFNLLKYFSGYKIDDFTGFLNIINNINNIIDYYSISKYMLSGYKNNQFYIKRVDYNLDYVKQLKKNIYLYQCVNLGYKVFGLYYNVFNKYNIYLKEFNKFEIKIRNLILKYNNHELKKCLKDIYISKLKEKTKIENIINNLKDYKYKTWYNFRNFMEDPIYCIENKEDFFDVLFNNLSIIEDELKNKIFFLSSLDLNNIGLLMNLCKNNKNNKNKKNKDKIAKAFKNIKNLLEKKQFKKEKSNKGKSNDNKDITSPYKNHIPFPLKDANKIKEYVRDKSFEIYNKLQEQYQLPGYNPYDYIKRYFRKFFGNLQDYKDFNK